MTSRRYQIQNPSISDSNEISTDNPKDNFRIVEQIVYGDKLQQGELLADAKYILHDNANGYVSEITGSELLEFFKINYLTTFIPWVMTRCTIIPI